MDNTKGLRKSRTFSLYDFSAILRPDEFRMCIVMILYVAYEGLENGADLFFMYQISPSSSCIVIYYSEEVTGTI